jgi:hypothetical protein
VKVGAGTPVHVPGDAVSAWPTIGLVSLIVGGDVLLGAVPEMGPIEFVAVWSAGAAPSSAISTTRMYFPTSAATVV